jgi:hypothetical protein
MAETGLVPTPEPAPAGKGAGSRRGIAGALNCPTVDQGRPPGTPLGLVEAIGHAAPGRAKAEGLAAAPTRRNGEAERLGCLEVDYELETGRLLNR